MNRRWLNVLMLGALVTLTVPSMGGCAEDLSRVLRNIAGDIDNIADDLVDDEDNRSFLDTLFGEDDD